MRIQCPKCRATTGEIQYNQIVARTVTFHLDDSVGDGVGDIDEEVFAAGIPTQVQCNECGYEGTAKEFGLKTETSMEQLFIMIRSDWDAYGSVKASSPERALEKSLDPNTATMYVPTHMHKQEKYGKEPDEVVKRIALKESLHYFDLNGEKKKRYTKEYIMLEVDLDSGSIIAH